MSQRPFGDLVERKCGSILQAAGDGAGSRTCVSDDRVSTLSAGMGALFSTAKRLLNSKGFRGAANKLSI